MAHTWAILAISTPALFASAALYSIPRYRTHITRASWVRATWLCLIGTLAAIVGFCLWTLASPADLKIETRVGIHEDTWRDSTTAAPGDTVPVMISFENVGRGVARDVLIGDNLPPYCEYVSNTTTMYNPSFPTGVGVEDGVTTGRLNVGNYGPGSGGHVVFQLRISSESPETLLRNVGIASIGPDHEVWDRAEIQVRTTQ